MEETRQIPAENSKPVIGTPEFARLGGEAREGTKNRKTIAKEEAWKTYEQTMVNSLMAITRSQLIIALGSHMIFRIDTITDDKGKKIRKKPVRITNETEITQFVEDLVNDELNEDDEDTYYFATAIDPNTSAISDILDRLNGKPKQTTQVEAKVSMNYEPETKQKVEGNIDSLLGLNS